MAHFDDTRCAFVKHCRTSPRTPEREIAEAQFHQQRIFTAATACITSWRTNHWQDGWSTSGYAEVGSVRAKLLSGRIIERRSPRVHPVLSRYIPLSTCRKREESTSNEICDQQESLQKEGSILSQQLQNDFDCWPYGQVVEEYRLVPLSNHCEAWRIPLEERCGFRSERSKVDCGSSSTDCKSSDESGKFPCTSVSSICLKHLTLSTENCCETYQSKMLAVISQFPKGRRLTCVRILVSIRIGLTSPRD